ncbi:MAG: type II secretion system GspH family protein [Bacillaceae bacterium]|nr:type II secretion system GspH family protein [Bacillaceae bacterium]
MWKKCEGFTLVETLCALFIWLMIASIIFPSFLLVIVERKNIMLERESRLLLQDFTQMMRVNQIQNNEHIELKREGIKFTIYTKNHESFTKVCVTYHDYKNRIKEKCELVYVEKVGKDK